MNILYIHQYFNTPKMPGSTRSYEFAKRLVNRGDTVYMITTNWQGKSTLSASIESGINVYWAPIRYSNKMSFLTRIITYLRYLWFVLIIGMKLDYDLIIASSTPLTVAIPAILLKYVKKIKLIFEVRDLWPELPIAIGAIKSPFIIRLAKFLEHKIYYISDYVIVLSSGMKSQLINKISENKLSIVTNLSDVGYFNVEDQKGIKYREHLSIPQNDPLIVYAGAFGRINGLSYLIDIANEMKKINSDVKFLLVGDGYEKKNLEEQSKQFGLLNKQIFFNEYISKSKMPDLLSAATITTSFFIDLPEMEHNSANKFFDSLAAGKPIMINYGGWQAELLRKTGAGIVLDSNNPKSAANKINQIIVDKSVLANMRDASNKLAYQFDTETNYKKFEKIIDKVLIQGKI